MPKSAARTGPRPKKARQPEPDPGQKKSGPTQPYLKFLSRTSAIWRRGWEFGGRKMDVSGKCTNKLVPKCYYECNIY